MSAFVILALLIKHAAQAFMRMIKRQKNLLKVKEMTHETGSILLNKQDNVRIKVAQAVIEDCNFILNKKVDS